MNALETRRKVKGLLLDYDDTMACTEVLALGAAYDFMAQELDRRCGLAVNHSKAEHIDRYAGTTFEEILSQLGPVIGFSFSGDELEELVEGEVEVVLEAFGNHLKPMPGSLELLRGCKQRQVLTAVVSSSATRRLKVCLEATGQNEFIGDGHIFSASDSMGRAVSKPNPAIYQYALEQLELEADDVYAVEDSLSGCRSAVAAGIKCIGFTGALPADRKEQRAEQLLEKGAVVVFDTLDEVFNYLTCEDS